MVLFIVYNFDTFYIEFYIVFSLVLISFCYAILISPRINIVIIINNNNEGAL